MEHRKHILHYISNWMWKILYRLFPQMWCLKIYLTRWWVVFFLFIKSLCVRVMCYRVCQCFWHFRTRFRSTNDIHAHTHTHTVNVFVHSCCFMARGKISWNIWPAGSKACMRLELLWWNDKCLEGRSRKISANMYQQCLFWKIFFLLQ